MSHLTLTVSGAGMFFLTAALLCLAAAVFLLFRLRKRCEELQSRLTETEEENRAFRDTLRTLETPADAIIGYSGLARRDGVTDTEKNEYLEMIEEAGRELISAVRGEGLF